MNSLEKFLIPSLIIIGFLILIFIGVKLLAMNNSVVATYDTVKSWDTYLTTAE